MISAEVICDSISEQGHRPTTFKLRYPKFIHGEFMTHRVASRNASSSRAIPTAKLIEEVRSDALRAGPVFWGANQKGMQAAEELDDVEKKTSQTELDVGSQFFEDILRTDKENAQLIWKLAALEAAKRAEQLLVIGTHKQIVNRLLEPFSHINVVATATEWDNFFGLRLHKDAQPEMRALAIAMWEARKASTPKLLKPGDWHTPFADYADGWTGKQCTSCGGHGENPSQEFGRQACTSCGGTGEAYDEAQIIKVSVARCARVSYESFETGKRSTVEEDLKLYDRLVGMQPLHASPAEHQCTPDILTKHEGHLHSTDRRTHAGPNNAIQYWDWEHQNEHGNLVGWRQFRKMMPNEAVAPIPEEFR